MQIEYLLKELVTRKSIGVLSLKLKKLGELKSHERLFPSTKDRKCRNNDSRRKNNLLNFSYAGVQCCKLDSLLRFSTRMLSHIVSRN